jgi:sec-independent protein translocase protein TatC
MSQTPKDDLFESSTMTFGEHLEELRVALFRSLVGLVVGFLIGLLVAQHVVLGIQTPLKSALKKHYEIKASERLQTLYGEDLDEEVVQFMKSSQLVFEDVLIERQELIRLGEQAGATEPAPPTASELADQDREPLDNKLPPPSVDMVKTRIWRESNSAVTALSAQESFMIWLKAAFVSGLIIASPYIFWQIWTFVAAGLYSYEKRYVYLFVPISLGLFWAGAALAFFFAFQFVLNFLFGFNRLLDIESDMRISEWMGFVLFLPLGFGIAFQLPLVMLFLNRIGIFTIHMYLDKWRVAILVIFVLSMILTPADPISMLLMAAPLTVLYFLGIAMAKWMPRGRNPFTEPYDP